MIKLNIVMINAKINFNKYNEKEKIFTIKNHKNKLLDLANLLIINKQLKENLNSDRSDECIDFTMIITNRNNAPISNFGGGFRCKSEYPWCIIEVKSKHFPTVFKKIEKNKKKKYHCKYLKCPPHVYVTLFIDHNNF
ncbi:Uncharacterized protein FWK35_00010454 [Aphis craccivora]|uniref:Uncharacterized protein n=1 Tax=Aphis craccivora TaxID=307492 RepID=A0A6G0YSA5_APHCR|nr:Uncharacterized protein FWK35_00010454 [Aphis craccivora]